MSAPEKLCKKCWEYWPADTEFFYSSSKHNDGLATACKACYSEMPSVVARNQRNPKGIVSAWEALFQSPFHGGTA